MHKKSWRKSIVCYIQYKHVTQSFRWVMQEWIRVAAKIWSRRAACSQISWNFSASHALMFQNTSSVHVFPLYKARHYISPLFSDLWNTSETISPGALYAVRIGTNYIGLPETIPQAPLGLLARARKPRYWYITAT